jgi:hypothetical protein
LTVLLHDLLNFYDEVNENAEINPVPLEFMPDILKIEETSNILALILINRIVFRSEIMFARKITSLFENYINKIKNDDFQDFD